MQRKKKRTPLPVRLLLIFLLIGALCFAGLLGYITIRERGVSNTVPEPNDYDAIIVLGAQVLPDGTPNVQLGWRLDAAMKAWREHEVPVVVCGAMGKDEPLPEADAMKQYLIGQGIPEEQILTDPESRNTNQNLQNAARLLKDIPAVKKVLIVTSDYHVPRAMALAGDLGYDAVGMGAPCKPEYWLKNHSREALAWVKYWCMKYLHLNL